MRAINKDFFKKTENTVRIIHTVLCVLHLGCLFFGVMKAFGGNNIPYRVARWLSLLPIFAFPTYLMKMFDFQTVVFGLFALWNIAMYIYKLIKRDIDKKKLMYDIVLWLVTFGELMFLGEYFVNMRYW